MSQNRLKAVHFLFPLLFTLGACSTLGLGETEKASACPDYLILKNAAQLEGEINDQKNPIWQVEVEKLAGRCTSRGDMMSMDLGMKFSALRQNTDTAIPSDLQYFVVILDDQQAVVSKQTDLVTFQFAGDDPNHAEFIELRKVEFPASNLNYKIYVGLQKADGK